MQPTLSGFTETPQGIFLRQAIAQIVTNPLVGSTVYHWKAKPAKATFNDAGQPDYLSPQPGLFDSGVDYDPNPNNPLRGIFCRPKQTPFQDKGGIYYQGEASLYLVEDPGEVFVVVNSRPKRQDRFEIAGGVYYAVAPVLPCQMGDTVAAFQVFLSRERFGVKEDGLSHY